MRKLLLAIAIAVALTATVIGRISESAEIPIFAELDPLTMYGPYPYYPGDPRAGARFLEWGQDAASSADECHFLLDYEACGMDILYNAIPVEFFYWKKHREGGGGYAFDDFSDVLATAGGLKLYYSPSMYDSLNGYKAWVSEKTEPAMDIWNEDFFLDRLGSGGLDFSLEQGYYCSNVNHPTWFVIGKPGAANDQLSSNWVSVYPWVAFFVGDKCNIWLEMGKFTDDHNDPDEALCTFYTKSIWGNTTYIDSTTWHQDDLETEWKFQLHQIVSEEYNRKNLQFALRWWGGDQIAIRKIKYAEERYLQVNPDSGQAGKWVDFVSSCCRIVSLDQEALDMHGCAWSDMIGWVAWEPWRYGRSTFRRFSDALAADDRMNYANLDLGDPLKPVLTANASGFDMEEYLEVAQPHALWWGSTYPLTANTTEESIGDDNIQEAWDRYIEGTWHEGDHLPWNDPLGNPMAVREEFWDLGLRTAANAVGDSIPLLMGIQSSGRIKKDSQEQWYLELRDPTPNMVKCQGFLAMSFSAKGFFYCYYCPVYDHDQSNPPNWYTEYPEPGQETIWNGATNTGLTTFWKSSQEVGDAIENDDELDVARGDGGMGVLRPNDKWDAAKEFNDYVRAVESIYSFCQFNQSECAAEIAPGEDGRIWLGRIGIDSTYAIGGGRDDPEETYLQVAILDLQIAYLYGDHFTFMLVNRRCAEDETRVVRFHVNFPLSEDRLSVCEVSSGDVLASGFGSSLAVVDTLQPGTGRLYLASTAMEVPDTIDQDAEWAAFALVSQTVHVLQGVKLEIKPGTLVLFKDNGQIINKGRILAKGKPDSLITFTTLNSSSTGLLQLNGTPTDSFAYCNFKHMKQGLKISKSSQSYKTNINHCEFAYCEEEGLNVSGGELTLKNSTLHDNGLEGAYLYNCKAFVDTCSFTRNERSGIYAYSINATSQINKCEFLLNCGSGSHTLDAGIRFWNCDPKLKKSTLQSNGRYGICGANGSNPIMYVSGGGTAANTLGDNASHETYWETNTSYPMIDYGHNNFDTDDDTLIYINGSPLSSLNCRGNYWGGGGPNFGSPSRSIVGVINVNYQPYDAQEQFRVNPGSGGLEDVKSGGAGEVVIDDAEEDAGEALIAALDLEENPADWRDAVAAYRRIISRYPGTTSAPIAVERLLWLIRNNYAARERDDQLDGLRLLYHNIADTSRAYGLAWKARRAALWAFAAQHRYDEAIRGFEEIIADPDCLADSIFAVIDAGTLHLEAREWAERDSLNRLNSLPGTLPMLAPASFAEHRRHTDELLALLEAGAYNGRLAVPTEYSLEQNYPNPFNATTLIQFGLPEAGAVKLVLYDLQGRLVRTLVADDLKAGYHSALWDGKSASGDMAASGVYFCRLQAGGFTTVRKMTLVR